LKSDKNSLICFKKSAKKSENITFPSPVNLHAENEKKYLRIFYSFLINDQNVLFHSKLGTNATTLSHFYLLIDCLLNFHYCWLPSPRFLKNATFSKFLLIQRELMVVVLFLDIVLSHQ
jgi:hypothetical protein